MTPNEFKTWFEGFTDALDGRLPTEAEWKRIRGRVASIGSNQAANLGLIQKQYGVGAIGGNAVNNLYENPEMSRRA